MTSRCHLSVSQTKLLQKDEETDIQPQNTINYRKEKPPLDPTERYLYQLGGRNLTDLCHDQKGDYVWLCDGNDGLYKYYL